MQILMVLIMNILLFVIVSTVIPGFGGMGNIHNIIIQVLILAAAAASQTFAILTGGIDLSIPWIMTTSGVLVATLTKGSDEALVWVIPIIFAVAVIIGLFNGIGIGFLKIYPIIMTMATNVIISGGIFVYVGFAPPSRSPELLVELIHGSILGIPNSLLILIVIALVITVILSLTTFGRQLYAIGTSTTVSKFSGITPSYILLTTYVFSSIFAAIAGLMLLGFTSTAYTGMGDNYLFISITAVIVGGASILGGSGHYLGTIMGAFLIIILNSLLIAFNLEAGYVKIFYGLVILLGVWFSSGSTSWLKIGKRRKSRDIDPTIEGG